MADPFQNVKYPGLKNGLKIVIPSIFLLKRTCCLSYEFPSFLLHCSVPVDCKKDLYCYYNQIIECPKDELYLTLSVKRIVNIKNIFSQCFIVV